MKRALMVLVGAGLLIASTGPSGVSAEHEELDIWAETDLRLPDLLRDGFEVVGTTFHFLPDGRELEIIYVQKKEKLYRCHTISAEAESTHECHSLRQPSRREFRL